MLSIIDLANYIDEPDLPLPFKAIEMGQASQGN